MKKNMLSYVVNLSLALVLTLVGAVSFLGAGVKTVKASSPYYNGNKSNMVVSIMFNVYGGEEYLDQIVETLNVYDAKATFFIGGVWAIKHEDAIIKLCKSGNEIANHGYLHRDHKKLSYTQNKDEIKTAERTIEGICGARTKLFAPPSGSFSADTIKACDDLGYKTIMWSKDTIDWRDQNVDLIVKRATENVLAGDLILMHPTKCSAQALPIILQKLKSKNFQIKTVSENIIIA